MVALRQAAWEGAMDGSDQHGKAPAHDFVEPVPVEAPEPLVVHLLPGTGTRLVVSLAGVGRVRNATPPPEFLGTASGAGENHVLFISDISRSWLNGPEVAENIVALIEGYRAEHGIDEVVLMGNSMGGFAALMLAQLTEVDTVIALAPQFSMNPDLVPEETRWRHWMLQIAEWRFPAVAGLERDRTRYFIFHGSHPAEARHWLRFPWHRGLNHFVFHGLGHDLAARMRKRRLLGRVIDACIAGKSRQVRLALERSFLGRRFEVSRREAYQPAHPELTLDPGGAPVVVPEGAA